MENLIFRYAKKDDVDKILYFIKELAKYENLLNEVVATKDLLEKWIFEEKKAEVVFAVVDDKEVGFVLFFHNFSTFLGKAGIYIEDLFVEPMYRGMGIGRKIIEYMAYITKQRGCGRLEWWCLDWNIKSIDFYLSLGAKPMSEWTVYRIDGEVLEDLANKNDFGD